jgi:hypothetical protein
MGHLRPSNKDKMSSVHMDLPFVLDDLAEAIKHAIISFLCSGGSNIGLKLPVICGMMTPCQLRFLSRRLRTIALARGEFPEHLHSRLDHI